MTNTGALAALIAAGTVLGGCGGGTGLPPDRQPTPEAPEDARGVPGFDTRTYPGDAVMAAWLQESPYRWVGYYLPAPCYTGTSWEGKRERLQDMGWGTAVLFVGEQDWDEAGGGALRSGVADSAAVDPAEAAAATEPRCTRSNLTPEKGRSDGQAAARAAAAEGFPRGAVVYLDVERVERVSEDLEAYVRGWTRALLEDGRYHPGLYAHGDNAEALMGTMEEAVANAGHSLQPRLWVAKTGGFSLRRGPTESGFPAAIWQGRLDLTETWAGHTLRIDANVADSSDP